MDSILTSVKKQLGITEEYEQFDADLIMHINSVFMILTQMGIGPAEGFAIYDNASLWEDYISNETTMQILKSYMALKVQMVFDPPMTSSVMESKKRMLEEFEWRLFYQAELDKIQAEEV